ncbi:hypothetical protein J4729_18800 [Leisingera sp. HS039]|uniref:hypothetical protein n=1 Tax=Leisingera sp. HS039 TaxID=2818496 RepID=UPI001B3A3109|nr:hypothetical protein [Leisingera sp. HS039]MBQ4826577.1 hypothetical protein [Leisingera sp. HS039]
MRTKSCRQLLRVPCLWSRQIEIHANGYSAGGRMWCNPKALEAIAEIEGFASFGNLQAWFENRYGLPAVGFTQIRWDFAAAIFVADSATERGSAP